MIVLRWTAAAVALAGVIDPSVPVPHRERSTLRLVGRETPSLETRLRTEGFTIGGIDAAATVVATEADLAPPHLRGPVYLLSPGAGVSIARVSVPPSRVAEQAAIVSAALHARGSRGQTTTVRLEDDGVPVATATHTWTADEETWNAALTYVPMRSDPAVLRVRIAGAEFASATADVLAPTLRGPIRTLVYDPAVTWASVFVRRALEGQSGFSVASVQSATATAAARAGGAPLSLTRAALAPYEVLVFARLDGVDPAAVEVIRWFVEERGGVLLLVPDRVPDGRLAALVPGMSFESRILDAPVALRGIADGLNASELAIPRGLGLGAWPLASDAAGTPIVVSMRRGMGALVVSGALDAWRYRDRGAAAFARFWPAVLITEASAVPPRLEVRARPAVVRPGGVVHLWARLRGTELTGGDRVEVPAANAHVVEPASGSDAAVRLWPTAEPGVYEGEWRPARAGRYAATAAVGDARGAAIVEVSSEAAADASSRASLRAAAQASGGVYTSEAALVAALAARVPATRHWQPAHPARSPWSVVAFAACLCAEWTARRRRGRA